MSVRRSLAALAVALVVAAAPLPAQFQYLHTIWGSGPSDIWAAGNMTAALHWDGRAWTEVPLGVDAGVDIAALWGSGPAAVFAVGNRGVLHWDGRTWTRTSAPADRMLVAIRGRSATDVYVVTMSRADDDKPLLLHYDGRAWSSSELPIAFNPSDLIVSPTEVTVIGSVTRDLPPQYTMRTFGVVARFAAGRWSVRGWDGSRSNDPVLGAVDWIRASQAGAATLIAGSRREETRDGDIVDYPEIAIQAGAAWRALPRPDAGRPPQGSDGTVPFVFLTGDGTPVALFAGMGFARFAAGHWTPVGVTTVLPQTPPPQPAGALVPPGARKEPRAAPRPSGLPRPVGAGPAPAPGVAAGLAQPAAASSPAAAYAAAAAFDMSEAWGAWGPSARDFWVVTSRARIVHVVGDTPTIVYADRCRTPGAVTEQALICQALRSR
ncbi:MAG: hypothetical protein AAB409_06200 [Gemmatimonadota bacterium]